MLREFTRRQLGRLAGTAALGASAILPNGFGETADAQTRPASGTAPKFPNEFYWGVATSAYQIEGSVNEDGRGPSIWDTYAHTPGKIMNGDNADIANDHYHLYKDDVKLMQGIGAKAYRFSVAWPRIFPTGTGQPNSKGLDFYSRLTDELLASGIEPFATLYHWDLPQVLQDKNGGWLSRDTAKAFADYSGYVAAKLSDRIKHFFTINEFLLVADAGYRGIDLGGRTIEMAPGLTLSPAERNQVRHHLMLGHGLSVQAIRAMGKTGTKCGPADSIQVAVPVIETPEHIKAAERATREINAAYLTVMLEGKYLDEYLTAAGKDAPIFSDQDLRVIATPVDFVGINLYFPTAYVIASDQVPGYRAIPLKASHPRMLKFPLGPELLYWGPRIVQSLWNPKEIFIIENGCATSDELAADGSVFDSDRVMFLRSNLLHLQRATTDGIPVKGYFHWSLMDDFEWRDGFSSRFGLVYVDFTTQKRTPKLSASYFREAAAQNAVV